MKPLLALLLLLLIVPELPAQIPDTQTGSAEVTGYGHIALQLSGINDGAALMAGGGAGVLLDHKIGVGISGYGLLNRVKGEPAPGSANQISFGCAGLDLRYIHNWDQPLHISASLLLGGGSVGYLENESWNPAETAMGSSLPGVAERDFFLLAEPAVDLEANIGSDLRVSLGAGYRLLSGVSLPGLSNSALSGFSGRIGFRLGQF
jgi:hypothetical protein